MLERSVTDKTPSQPLPSCAVQAARVALDAFLNAFLRETGEILPVRWQAVSDTDWQVHLPLIGKGYVLRIDAPYHSETGHHQFRLPVTCQEPCGRVLALDTMAAIKLILTTLAQQEGEAGAETLLAHMRESLDAIERILGLRQGDLPLLRGEQIPFIKAEQALLAGHAIHPSPKSREGFSREEEARFAPEFAQGFALHWFAVQRRLVRHDHADTAPEAMQWLAEVPGADLERMRQRLSKGDHLLYPLHPWQAQRNLEDPRLAAFLANGEIEDLGPLGEPFFATSSVRTLYRPDLPFMLKFSLGVGITNSVRITLFRELLRGLELERFAQSALWGDFIGPQARFSFISDPAFLALAPAGEVIDTWSLSFRRNPFRAGQAHANVTSLAALAEDLPGVGSRLGHLVRRLAKHQGLSLEAAALLWFEAFLGCTILPLVRLYLTHGIALEAHQQNVLVGLKDDLPHHGYYRDNQGFFHHDNAHEALMRHLPGLGEESQSIGPEALVDERLAYYLILNSAFGIIGALGRAGVARELILLRRLAQALENIERETGSPSGFVRLVLGETLACKANLLTRLHGMDELVGPPETQSVYRDWANPLYHAMQPETTGGLHER